MKKLEVCNPSFPDSDGIFDKFHMRKLGNNGLSPFQKHAEHQNLDIYAAASIKEDFFRKDAVSP